ncbi:MAG: phosphonate ABC transporter ATP-binding protein [Planctomycetota bacterium]
MRALLVDSSNRCEHEGSQRWLDPSEASARGLSVRMTGLTCRFGQQLVLDDVSMNLRAGEIVALLGASGAGKSTLLRHVAGLVAPDAGSGEICVGDQLVQSGGKIQQNIRQIRADIGFVFQQFNLVERVSLFKNVLMGHLSRMPLHRRLAGWFSEAEKRDAMRALAMVDLESHAMQRAGTLSGGQQQRGAIARAMVQRARLVLADEPIASLDPESARLVMDGLREINRRDGVTVLVSVHQIEHAKRTCDRIIALRNGKIFSDGPVDEFRQPQIDALYGRTSSSP